jgi:nucleoside-diphosphate-sugar epimerase
VAAHHIRAQQNLMRVLITGASGFVGRPLVEALGNAGHGVRAAVRDRRALDFPAGVEIAHMPDLAGVVDWTPLLDGIDAVVHLAAIAHAEREVSDDEFDRVNHRATAAFARAAMAAGVKRFVFVSSIGAQSGPTSARPLSEADTPAPTKSYGRAKLAAENAVRESGVPYTILRPMLVYGPNPKGNMAKLVRLARLPVPLPFGALHAPRSLVALDNLVGAIRFALEDECARNETFIVADSQTITVAEIISILRTASGRSPALIPVPAGLISFACSLIGRREQWDQLAGSLVAPPTKLMAAGWRPAVDPKSAFKALAQAASPEKSGTASRSAP